MLKMMGKKIFTIFMLKNFVLLTQDKPLHGHSHRVQSSVYSMPQSNKFIVYFSILLEMAYY